MNLSKEQIELLQYELKSAEKHHKRYKDLVDGATINDGSYNEEREDHNNNSLTLGEEHDSMEHAL
jgi:hypothetical protein